VEGGMRTTITFVDLGDGRTEVTTHQPNVPEAFLSAQARAGFESSLDRFEAYLATLPAARPAAWALRGQLGGHDRGPGAAAVGVDHERALAALEAVVHGTRTHTCLVTRRPDSSAHRRAGPGVSPGRPGSADFGR